MGCDRFFARRSLRAALPCVHGNPAVAMPAHAASTACNSFPRLPCGAVRSLPFQAALACLSLLPSILVVLWPAPAAAIQINDFSSAVNSRFDSGYPNGPLVANTSPSFMGLGYDWSGVGWNQNGGTQSFALITPRQMLIANHYTPGIGQGIQFVNASGQVTTVTVQSQPGTHAGAPDMATAQFSNPIPQSAGITAYSILFQGYNTSKYVGDNLLTYGQMAAIGWNQINTVNTGTNLGFPPPYGPDPAYYMEYLYDTTTPNRSQLQSGDSGSPSFITTGTPGVMYLAGAHYLTSTGYCGIDTFLPMSLPALDADTAPAGYLASVVTPTTARWTGTTSGVWSASNNNWTPTSSGALFNDVLSGGTVTTCASVDFDGVASSQHAVTLSGSHAVTSLIFNLTPSTTAGFTFNGGSLTLGEAGLTNNDIHAQTFNNAVILRTSQQWHAGPGGVSISASGSLNLGANQLLYLDGSGTSDFEGVTSGPGSGIAKDGSGTLILGNANNSFSGTIFVHNGTLQFASVQNVGGGNSALGAPATAASGTIYLAGRLAYVGSGSSSNRVIDIADGPGASGATGIIDASGSGLLNMSGGVICENAAGTSRLVLQGAGSGSQSGAITDGGTANALSLIKSGSGTWTLSGPNSYTGSTTVNAGTLVAAVPAALPGYGTPGLIAVSAGAVLDLPTGDGSSGWSGGQIGSLLAGATWANSAALAIDTTSGNSTYGGNIIKALELTKLGANALILTGGNTYSGGTTIGAGTLQVGNGYLSGSLGSGPVFVNSKSVLSFDPAATAAFPNSITGGGAVALIGSATIVLAGSNTYSGGTTISAGTLYAMSPTALPGYNISGMVGIFAGGGLDIPTGNGTTGWSGGQISSLLASASWSGSSAALGVDTTNGSFTYSGNITPSLALTKLGANTLTLTGSNSYTGQTTVAGGVLNLDFSQPGAPTANIINNAADSSALALSGATLAIQGNPDAANSQRFNGLAVNPGNSAIVLTAATANSLVLNLGSISRSPGGMVDFTLPSGAQSASNGITTTTPNTAGILGGYATVSGTNWAASSGTSGNITAYTAYTGGDLGTLGGPTVLGGGTLNVAPGGPQTAVTTADSFNTLNLAGTVGITMSGSGSITLVSGGLIGNTSGSISGGTLMGSASGDLILTTAANLTIGSAIADNGGATGLTKAGPGMLTLTDSNTYSGATTIAAGTLQVGAAGALGSGAVFDCANLDFNLPGVTHFSGPISGPGNLIQSGPGVLALGGTNGYTGETIVADGTLEVLDNLAISGGGLLAGSNAGTLFPDLSANSTAESGSNDSSASSGDSSGGLPVSSPTAMNAVPEPGALLLLLIAGGSGLLRAWISPRHLGKTQSS
jgi:fibronectin-binding autotransporter adhesin